LAADEALARQVERCTLAAQLEAQRAAGGYQASGGESAVYSGARFDQDELEWVVEGPEQFGTQVRIRSRS
ncbi:MAG TPA: hypothetical protein PLF84_23535, partial [Bryobacteraceae bacterium]|nr:hypothetical protein [Bryobacteraceae bacterium]